MVEDLRRFPYFILFIYLFCFGVAVVKERHLASTLSRSYRYLSGSTLFATHAVILHTFTGSKIDVEEKHKAKIKWCEYLG